MFNDLVNSSDLKHPEMLRPNAQRQCNPTFNLGDKLVDIKTNLEEFSNILQQRKRILKVGNNTVFQPSHNNLLVGQKKYRKK